MTSVMNFNDVNISEIQFSEPKPNAKGGQTVWLSYNESKIIVQIPKGKCPFGLNSQTYDDSPKFDVSLSLGGSEKMNAFNEWLSQFDQRICQVAMERSPQWFGKKKSGEVIEEMYKTMKTVPKKGNYAPTMKLKCPYYDGEHKVVAYDDKRNEISIDAITKGTEAIFIAQLTNMWFVGKQFGVTWQLVQAKVYAKSAIPSYAFADEDSDSE